MKKINLEKQREKLLLQLKEADEKIAEEESQRLAKEEIRKRKEEEAQLKELKEQAKIPLSEPVYDSPISNQIPKVKFSNLSNWIKLWIILGIISFSLIAIVIFITLILI